MWWELHKTVTTEMDSEHQTLNYHLNQPTVTISSPISDTKHGRSSAFQSPCRKRTRLPWQSNTVVVVGFPQQHMRIPHHAAPVTDFCLHPATPKPQVAQRENQECEESLSWQTRDLLCARTQDKRESWNRGITRIKVPNSCSSPLAIRDMPTHDCRH